MSKQIKKAEKINKTNKILIFLIICISCISIGYAALISTVEITGTASAVKFGNILIEEVAVKEFNNTINNSLNYHGNIINTSVDFQNSQNATITYEIKITNASDTIKKYTGETFEETSNTINYEITGDLVIDDHLFPGESRIVYLTYTSSQTGTYNPKIIFNFEDAGNFYAKCLNNNVDLSSVNLAPVKIKIMNSNQYNIDYTLSLDNDKFEITNASGILITQLTITEKTSKEIEVYIRKKTDITLYKSKYTSNLSISYNDNKVELDQLDITTNIKPKDEDNTPPQIGPVLIVINNPVGEFDVNWSRTDNTGAPVVKYFVKLYNDTNTLVQSVETDGSITTYHFTNMEPDTYYALVYGLDEAENSGEGECDNATQNTTDCRRSANTEIRWIRTITYKLDKVTCTTKDGGKCPDTINLGDELYLVFKSNNPIYDIIYTITDSNNRDVSYDEPKTNHIKITNVRDDLNIEAAIDSGCLLEGTKILLADGTYKNIENIGYDDLIMVYSHEIGKFVPEYPIWIEKPHTSDDYQQAIFSDGTVLNTISKHAVFSADDNRYVDVTNRKEFHVGTKIKKVIKEGNNYKFKDVEVKSIKTIYRKVNYYYVVSTRYYNLVSDNILTSDGRTELSNFYKFKENLLWSNRRQEAIKNNTFYDYNKFSRVPYYLFHGLRAQDGAVIVKYKYMTEKQFFNVFKELLTNHDLLLEPNKDKDNNRIWMVTTSDDVVNNQNKDKYLHKENSKYILPEPINKKGFYKWYSTMDNKYYNPGDEITVYHGTHFIAIYNKLTNRGDSNENNKTNINLYDNCINDNIYDYRYKKNF